MHRLECFGRVAVTTSGGEDQRLRSRKHLAVLLYLAARPRRSISRADLASLFWQTEPRLARHSLSQALYDIRSKIPDLELQATVHRIEYTGRGVAYDADRFEDALRDNRLSEAVGLYEGEFAPSFERVGDERFERWLEGERQRLRRLAEAVLCRYVALCDDRARWGEMRVTASRLLEMNPLNEEAHRALMRSLWLQGEQAAALRHFEERKPFLERELPGGLAPDTLGLVRRIRRSTVEPQEPLVKERPRAPLVGRAEPFRLLKRASRESRSGEGRVVLVRGEAGIGKSRLLEEFAEHAALEDVLLFESRCYAAESGVPYGPVVDGLGAAVERLETLGTFQDETAPRYYQLGHLFPEAFGSPESGVEAFTGRDAGRRRLHEETADLLRRVAAQRPVVWLLEDVHWIDDASAELVHYLGRRLAEHPFLLVTTVRSYTDLNSAASKLLDGLPSLETAVEIELEGLSYEETSELVTNLQREAVADAIASRIHRLSGGNPFLISELVRTASSLGESGAAGALDRSSRLFTGDIRSLLSRRMQGLAPDAVRILEVVAAAGRDARPGVVAESAGVAPDRLADLARSLYDRGLLRDAEERLEFAHHITREFVYSDLGDLQRAALHLALGEVLARPSHETDPATLARHFQLGGDRPRAFRYALEAAAAAGDRHAHKEAAELARLALGQTRSDRQKAESLMILYRAQLASGDLGNAQSRLEDLITLDQLSAMETAAIRLDLARARLELASWDQALEQIEEVESVLGDPSDAEQLELLLHALHLKLKVAIRRNQPVRAEEVVERLEVQMDAVDDSTKSDGARLLFDASRLAYSLFYGAPSERAKWARTLDVYEAVGSPNIRLTSLILAGVAAARAAHWDRAEYYFRQGLRRAQDQRDVKLTVSMLNNLACCAVEQGDWSTARRLFEDITAATSNLPERMYAKIGPEINRGTFYFYTERADKALSIFDPLLQLVELSGIGASSPDLHACMGLIALQQGRRRRAQMHHKKVASLSDVQLQAVQDRFKVLWLNAFMRFQEEPSEAISYLREAAERDAETDVVSAAKSRWLASLLAQGPGKKIGSRSDGDHGSVEALQQHGLKWFAYFSRRWLRRAEGAVN